MDELKRQRLEAAGWKAGTVNDFLQLSPEESEIVEVKLALSRKLKSLRKNGHLTQTSLAEKMSSSQSRVAKIEAGDPSVSVDLLIHALLCVGATRAEIGQVFIDTRDTSDNENELVLA
jgi:DNA-binding XRE family transcriptional regulator